MTKNALYAIIAGVGPGIGPFRQPYESITAN